MRLEADFGHIYVDYPDGRRLVSVLLATWSYSHARFAIKLPSERIEAVLCGLVEAMNFFSCVPEQLWWDYVAVRDMWPNSLGTRESWVDCEWLGT